MKNPVPIIIAEIHAKPLACLAMALSMSGAYLTSDENSLFRLIGFLVWLVSNGIIAWEFFRYKNWFMVATYIFFEIMNVRGVWNNWM